METKQTFVEDHEYLQGLGILIPGKKYFKNKGYIKLYTEDFIVQEITQNDELVDIKTKYENEIDDINIKQNFKATLIQSNIGTLEVVKKLSKKLNIPETNIQYAGIKDNDALTAQKITLQNVSFVDLQSVNSENYYLKDIEKCESKLRIGELKGNRFTILVRLDPTNIDQEELKEKIADIEKNGFYNFYYSQRFGTLGRDNNHILGRLALQGRYSDALFTFLTKPPRSGFQFMFPIFEEIKTNYGNWEYIEKLLEKHPEHFEKELEIIRYLIKNPYDHEGAIASEIRFWMLGFVSWLFNIKLSQYIIEGKNIPNKLDLITSTKNDAVKNYRNELDLVGVDNFDLKHLEKFNIQRATFPVDTKKKVTFEKINFVESGVILSFTLDKGSYATTVLAHFLDLIVGSIPENFSKEKSTLQKEMCS